MFIYCPERVVEIIQGGRIMPTQKKGSFQDFFLSQLRIKKIPVMITCTNGDRHEGEVQWFDNFTVILKEGKKQTLIYKQGIVSITPEQEGEIIQAGYHDKQGRH